MYRNVIDAVTDLQQRGFTGFEFSGDDLLKTKEKMLLTPDEFMIIESHRFCMPPGKDADIIVHGIVMHGSMARGILISHCHEPCNAANNSRPHNHLFSGKLKDQSKNKMKNLIGTVKQKGLKSVFHFVYLINCLFHRSDLTPLVPIL